MKYRKHILSACIAVALFVTPITAMATETYADGLRALEAGNNAKALRIWKARVEYGDVQSLIVLGQMYATGMGVQKSIETAMGYHLNACAILRKDHKSKQALEYAMPYATLGYADAKNELARLYLAQGSIESRERANNILSGKFLSENAEANYVKGLWVLRQPKISLKDKIKARTKWWEKSAEMGYAKGQANTGYAYSNGRGVEKSYETAVYWYKKAIAQNTGAGLYGLSDLYKNGHGVKRDDKEAARLMEKAAGFDHYKAQIDIASRYWRGRGVEKNLTTALTWYAKAKETILAQKRQGEEIDIKVSIGISADIQKIKMKQSRAYTAPVSDMTAAQGTTAYINKDYKKAFQIWKPLADAGDKDAQAGLGILYDNGRGVPGSNSDAMMWYRKAAEQGQALARYNLGVLFTKGVGLTADHDPKLYQEAGIDYIEQSAKQGYPEAQYSVGMFWLKGMGHPASPAEAYKWFSKAAAQNHAQSQYYVGMMLIKGVGVTKDEARGLVFLQKAAAQNNVDAQKALQQRITDSINVLKQILENPK